MVSSIALEQSQFNISHLFAHSLFYLIHRKEPGPGSNGNERALHILQIFKVGASPSDCLMSYPGHLLGGGAHSSAEIQSLYSTAPANWTEIHAITMP